MTQPGPNPDTGMGGNRPPLIDPDLLAREKARVQTFADAAGDWLDLGKIDTEEQAAKLHDYITGARAVAKQVDAARAEAKKPHDDAAKAVQATFRPLLDAIETAIGRVRPMLTDYLQRKKAAAKAEAERKRAEAARLAREAEEARAAAEARHDVLGEAEAAAAAEAAEKAAAEAARPARANVASYSGGGRSAGLRTQKSVVVDNIRQAFLAVQDDPAVVVAVEAALNRIVRSKDWNGKVPAGCRVEERKVAA